MADTSGGQLTATVNVRLRLSSPSGRRWWTHPGPWLRIIIGHDCFSDVCVYVYASPYSENLPLCALHMGPTVPVNTRANIHWPPYIFKSMRDWCLRFTGRCPGTKCTRAVKTSVLWTTQLPLRRCPKGVRAFFNTVKSHIIRSLGLCVPASFRPDLQPPPHVPASLTEAHPTPHQCSRANTRQGAPTIKPHTPLLTSTYTTDIPS